MVRRFAFEAEVWEKLEFVPLAVRRKLDRAGVKLSLAQWRPLGPGERLALCHLPCDTAEELDALRLFLGEAVRRTSEEKLQLLDNRQGAASEVSAPPPILAERAGALGFSLTQALWDRLDPDERYALAKLGGGREPSRNFAAALAELLGPHATSKPKST